VSKSQAFVSEKYALLPIDRGDPLRVPFSAPDSEVLLSAVIVGLVDAGQRIRFLGRQWRLSESAREGTLPTASGPFDIILANLIAGLIVRMAAELHTATKAGGRLLAGGIYVDREPEVRRALNAAGFHVGRRDIEGDWVMLEAERID